MRWAAYAPTLTDLSRLVVLTAARGFRLQSVSRVDEGGYKIVIKRAPGNLARRDVEQAYPVGKRI